MKFVRRINHTAILIVAGGLFLVSCTSQKILQATGGSRADGIVNLSYEAGAFETPVIDWDQANAVALKRCEAWGYSAAEAFGGVTKQCQAFNGFGNCIQAFITVPYQCTNDDATPTTAQDRTPTVLSPGNVPAAAATAYAPPANTGSYVPPVATPTSPTPAGAYPPPAPASANAAPSTAHAYAPPSGGAVSPSVSDPYAIDP